LIELVLLRQIPILLCLVTAIIMAAACRSRGEPYHNFEKWKILPFLAERPLEGHPRQVVERSFAAADSEKPEKKRFLYYKFAFDDKGNLVRKDAYMSDQLAYFSVWQYDSDGPQEITEAPGLKDSNRSTTRSLGDGRYKTISYRGTGIREVRIIAFPSSGRERIEELYKDTAATGRSLGSLHVYYDGSRVIKKTSLSKDGNVEERFFYSKWASPDSIETFDGAKLAVRELFPNNRQGDPERHLTIAGNDTTGESYQYVYDRHGNWTKRVTIPLRPDTTSVISVGGATVDEREFVY
jgi:hypothetical protein